jgi:hypothetical protein
VASPASAPSPSFAAADQQSEKRRFNPWLTLVIVCVAQFMVVLDATIVNVALPSIQKGLHFSRADLQWVINGYTLLFGGFLLLGGRAADLLERGGGDAVEHVAHGGGDELLLGGEVPEGGALPDAGAGGDLSDGGVEPALAEHLHGGIEQRTPVALGVGTLAPRLNVVAGCNRLAGTGGTHLDRSLPGTTDY